MWNSYFSQYGTLEKTKCQPHGSASGKFIGSTKTLSPWNSQSKIKFPLQQCKPSATTKICIPPNVSNIIYLLRRWITSMTWKWHWVQMEGTFLFIPLGVASSCVHMVSQLGPNSPYLTRGRRGRKVKRELETCTNVCRARLVSGFQMK